MEHLKRNKVGYTGGLLTAIVVPLLGHWNVPAYVTVPLFTAGGIAVVVWYKDFTNRPRRF